MDLTARLVRRTPPRPLTATAVGGERIRFATERLCAECGWRPAVAPAEANLLVVCGVPDEDTAHAADEVWAQIPRPRARVHLTDVAAVTDRMTEAVAVLRDPAALRADRTREEASGDRRAGNDPEPAGRCPGHTGRDHDDRGGHPHGGHGGTPGSGDMETPAGPAMADRAEDRDGLTLDRLHVTLGPVLPYWPAGLRLRTGLQGDVVQTVDVEVLAAGTGSRVPPEARVLDHAAALLSLAGWEAAARAAHALRDAALGGHPPHHGLAVWAARVRRSRTLRWSLAGLGPVDGPGTTVHGDVLDRLYRWLDGLCAAAAWTPAVDTRVALDALPSVLAGTELAAARLIVASLGIDLGALDREPAS